MTGNDKPVPWLQWLPFINPIDYDEWHAIALFTLVAVTPLLVYVGAPTFVIVFSVLVDATAITARFHPSVPVLGEAWYGLFAYKLPVVTVTILA